MNNPPLWIVPGNKEIMARIHRLELQEPSLVNRHSFRVRFSEVDAMRVVWHGEYIRYFEDGREAFGREFGGLSYTTITDEGYYIPIVKLEVDYIMPLKHGDTAIVETRFVNTKGAKILMEYVIYRESDMAITALGRSLQVFTRVEDNEIEINTPEFFIKWKEKWNII